MHHSIVLDIVRLTIYLIANDDDDDRQVRDDSKIQS